MENTENVSSVSVEQNSYVKGVVEAILFINESPVTLDQFKRVFETLKPSDIKESIDQLKNEYHVRQSGVSIIEIAGGYQMLSNPQYAGSVRDFYKTKHKEKLSKPSLETLAIIAYKQPITRGDIELIRGVNSDGVVAHLLSKELIKVVGRRDVAGKPFIYGTTKEFLEYFGLKSLEILPKLEEFPEFMARAQSNLPDSTTSVQEESNGQLELVSIESSTDTQENRSEDVQPPTKEEANDTNTQ